MSSSSAYLIVRVPWRQAPWRRVCPRRQARLSGESECLARCARPVAGRDAAGDDGRTRPEKCHGARVRVAIREARAMTLPVRRSAEAEASKPRTVEITAG